MLNVTEISAMVAAAGVMIGVVYYVLEIRHQARTRQTDLITRLHPVSNMSYREWREYLLHLPMDYKDYDDFVKKYGSFMSGKPEPEAVLMTLTYFETLGILLRRKLLSINMVYDFYGMYNAWFEKLFKPLIEGFRKEWNIREFVFCEYLFNEMKKREQQLQQSKA